MRIRTANLTLLIINFMMLCVNIYLMNNISDLFQEIQNKVKTDEIKDIIDMDEVNDIIDIDEMKGEVKVETKINQNTFWDKDYHIWLGIGLFTLLTIGILYWEFKGSGAPNTGGNNVLELLSIINERSKENDLIIGEVVKYAKKTNNDLNFLVNLTLTPVSTPIIEGDLITS